MRRCILFSLFALAVVLAQATPASAQNPFLPPPVTVLPSARTPGATPIPNTYQPWYDPVSGASGIRYLGVDGQWHGVTQFTNPATGKPHIIVYAARPGTTTTRFPSRLTPSPSVSTTPAQPFVTPRLSPSTPFSTPTTVTPFSPRTGTFPTPSVVARTGGQPFTR